MSRPIPTLGYRSRTEAAVALTGKGIPDAIVARKIGISRQKLSQHLWWAQRRRKRAVLGVVGKSWNVRLPQHVRAAMAAHAHKRGVRPTDIVRLLLETAVSNDLVDTLLMDVLVGGE